MCLEFQVKKRETSRARIRKNRTAVSKHVEGGRGAKGDEYCHPEERWVCRNRTRKPRGWSHAGSGPDPPASSASQMESRFGKGESAGGKTQVKSLICLSRAVQTVRRAGEALHGREQQRRAKYTGTIGKHGVRTLTSIGQ